MNFEWTDAPFENNLSIYGSLSLCRLFSNKNTFVIYRDSSDRFIYFNMWGPDTQLLINFYKKLYPNTPREIAPDRLQECKNDIENLILKFERLKAFI